MKTADEIYNEMAAIDKKLEALYNQRQCWNCGNKSQGTCTFWDNVRKSNYKTSIGATKRAGCMTGFNPRFSVEEDRRQEEARGKKDVTLKVAEAYSREMLKHKRKSITVKEALRKAGIGRFDTFEDVDSAIDDLNQRKYVLPLRDAKEYYKNGITETVDAGKITPDWLNEKIRLIQKALDAKPLYLADYGKEALRLMNGKTVADLEEEKRAILRKKDVSDLEALWS